MGHFSKANTAETEIPVVCSCSSADLASVMKPYCKFLRFCHFCNPCFCSHITVALLLFSSPFLEGETHEVHKHFAFLVILGGSNKSYIHTMCFGRFFNVNFREYIMFPEADVEVSSPVKTFSVKTLEVPDAGRDNVYESVKEFIHLVAS